MNNQAEKTVTGRKDKRINELGVAVCSCGAKILVVPDVAAMAKAVKNHLAEHKGADEDYLIAQIFEAACNPT
jgi:hypothetical protein